MTQPTNFTYFKVAFLAIAAGLTAGLITKGLFNADFNDLSGFGDLIFKSLIVGIIVGFLMGLLNMYFKIGSFKKLND
ncbi:MAG: hypothetical protein RLZZ540_651 [Bacteroidota bacterium]|jgi:hypothetical protein